MAARKKSVFKTQDTTLRHFWLAGLGAVALARRQAVNGAGQAAAKVHSLRQQASQLASQYQSNVMGGIASVREQGEAAASQFSNDVEARLAPVLAKLGLKSKVQVKRGRKQAAKKVVVKRTRSAPARKQAGKRPVRKSRA